MSNKDIAEAVAGGIVLILLLAALLVIVGTLGGAAGYLVAAIANSLLGWSVSQPLAAVIGAIVALFGGTAHAQTND